MTYVHHQAVDWEKVRENKDIRYRLARVKIATYFLVNLLREYLELPDDVFPVAVAYDFDIDCFDLKLCSPKFDEVEEGQSAPIIAMIHNWGDKKNLGIPETFATVEYEDNDD